MNIVDKAYVTRSKLERLKKITERTIAEVRSNSLTAEEKQVAFQYIMQMAIYIPILESCLITYIQHIDITEEINSIHPLIHTQP